MLQLYDVILITTVPWNSIWKGWQPFHSSA